MGIMCYFCNYLFWSWSFNGQLEPQEPNQFKCLTLYDYLKSKFIVPIFFYTQTFTSISEKVHYYIC